MTTKGFRAIVDDIVQQINDGRLRPGDKLPSTRDLAAHYNVSTSTIDRVFTVLEYLGCVEGQPGKGRWVKGPRTGQNG